MSNLKNQYINTARTVEIGNPSWQLAQNSGLTDLSVRHVERNRMVDLNGHSLMNMCSCSYLGLEIDPRLARRAADYVLYDVGGKQSLEDAYSAFSQVKVMYPDIVGDLLQRCTSVKAKRLFLKWGRECGQLNVDTVLSQYRIPVGSNSRWITRLKDGSMLSLKPYG